MALINIPGVNTLQAGQTNPNIQFHQAPPTAATPSQTAPAPSSNDDSVQISSGANDGDANIGGLVQGLADAFGDVVGDRIGRDGKSPSPIGSDTQNGSSDSKAPNSSSSNSSRSNSSSNVTSDSSSKNDSASASRSSSSSSKSSTSSKN